MNRQLEEQHGAGVDELDPCDLGPGRVKGRDDQAGLDWIEHPAVGLQFKPDGLIGGANDINDDGRAAAADIQELPWTVLSDRSSIQVNFARVSRTGKRSQRRRS